MDGLMIGIVFLVGFGLLTAAFPPLWWDLSRRPYRHPEAVESGAAFAVARVVGVARRTGRRRGKTAWLEPSSISHHSGD